MQKLPNSVAEGAYGDDVFELSVYNLILRIIIGVIGHPDVPWTGVMPDSAVAGAVS